MANKRLIKKWVKALRSLEYKQGRGALRVGDNFCCLGVLCDIFAKEGKGKWNSSINSPEDKIAFMAENSVTVYDLPNEIANLVDLPDGKEGTFIKLNDTRRWSFEAIANKLERDYLNAK